MRDDVDEFAASYGIVHDMTMWAHPHRAFRDGHVAWQRASRRHATPADTAGEPRRVGAEQVLSDNRMNAIGADDDVGRPPSLSPHQRKEAMQRLAEGVVQADLAAPGPFAVSAVGV